jgi:8-oxo-dGTP diphosphatase
LQHRVRAAVLMVEDDRLLLVKHVHPETGETWWIPPGGGLEPEDESILACALREVYEETGLEVDLGPLLYLREFREAEAGVHHLELFFLGSAARGELTLEHVKGSGPDEAYIRDVAWVSRADLPGKTVHPEHLTAGFWDDLQQGFPGVRYLGVQLDGPAVGEPHDEEPSDANDGRQR